MNIAQLKDSKFLTRADVGKGMLVTIRGDVFQENVAKQGAPEELRWCIQFDECEKPMVLNSTNGQLIAKVTGSEESERWNGHKVVLFDDPTVSFGGKLVGGIRVRAPRQPPAKPVPSAIRSAPPVVVQPAPQPESEYDPGEGAGDPETPF